MTTINNTNDFLRALEQNPEFRDAARRHLLADALIQLPEQFAQLVEQFTQLTRQVTQLAQAFNEFVSETNRRLASLEQNQEITNQRLASLEQNQETTNQRLMSLEQGQARMSGDLSNIKGTDYETRVGVSSLRRAAQLLGIYRASIIKDNSPRSGTLLDNVTADARDQGIITYDEVEELHRADIVLQGNNPEGETVFAVIEASITVEEYDVTRAANRAGLLTKATRCATTPVVIGSIITDDAQAKADHNGVIFVHFAMPAPEDT